MNHLDLMLPVIDGHFWVESNGKILDTNFPYYDMIKMCHNLKGEMMYKEADAFTQELMLIKFRKALNKVGLDEKEYLTLKTAMHDGKAVMNECYYNSLLAMKEGDRLVFGSLGWKKRDGSGVWWEYGGEDWKGIKAFLK